MNAPLTTTVYEIADCLAAGQHVTASLSSWFTGSPDIDPVTVPSPVADEFGEVYQIDITPEQQFVETLRNAQEFASILHALKTEGSWTEAERASAPHVALLWAAWLLPTKESDAVVEEAMAGLRATGVSVGEETIRSVAARGGALSELLWICADCHF